MPRLLFVVFFLLMSIIQLSAVAGFGDSAPMVTDTVNPAISLLAPISGDIWYVGQNRDINWIASDTNLRADSIFVYYSLDGGATYNPLAGPLTNTGTYSFPIPEWESDIARVRAKAIDSFGNSTLATNSLSITYGRPQQVKNVEISLAGNEAVISWQAVTHNELNQPITPDGYLLFWSYTPSQNPADYTFLADTFDTSYSYPDASLASRMFFYVVAYKDYSGRLRKLLQQGTRATGPSPTLQEIRNRVYETGRGGGK